MSPRIPVSIGAIAGSTLLLALSVALLHRHVDALKDVREYALPLAAEVAPLERRAALLTQQSELSELETTVQNDSAGEKLRVYVLPQGRDLTRLLGFLESTRTFLERRELLRSMSAIEVAAAPDLHDSPLQTQTLRFSAVLKPEGRAQLLSILELSGLLTVGDVLTPEHIATLFGLTERQNYAGIIPVQRFLSADLLSYAQDPRLTDERLAQALPSEEFLTSFKGLLRSAALPQVRDFLTGDLGRSLVAQKLWPVQFMTIERESLKERTDGMVEMELTVKAYSRKH